MVTWKSGVGWMEEKEPMYLSSHLPSDLTESLAEDPSF